VSEISGVGVFAIKDIPKGTHIFEPDDDELISVSRDEVEKLEPQLRRLYEDFCVLIDDTYQCPSTFNKLTPSWYLNNSKDPNVAADPSLKFYAIRDIEAGEELTADYSTYSDNQLTPTG
jgi:SET domain-containing protein